VGTRLELRLDDPVDSRFPRAAAAGLPYGPGAALSPDGAAVRLALADGTEPVRTGTRGRAPRIVPLPLTVREDEVGRTSARDAGFVLGVAARRGRPVLLPLLEPGAHLLVVGDRGSGRTTLLRRVACWYAARDVGDGAHPCLHLLGPRRTLGDLADLPAVTSHAVTGAQATETVHDLVERLQRGGAATRRHVVVVDDAELLLGGDLLAGASALDPLASLLPSAADVGLHLVLARRVAGLARAAYDPVLARLREHAAAVLVLSGDRTEGPVVGGVAPSVMPPGRGRLVRAYGGPPDGELVQCALPAPSGP
jgi:S-DNA-T family DNA segregation ATPase FtsK/SpoIIIE